MASDKTACTCLERPALAQRQAEQPRRFVRSLRRLRRDISMIARAKTTTNGKGREVQAVRILQIGNYPPPACGWAIQTKFLVEEIRRRGIVCDVLNINENRAKKSHEYIDVQNGLDYLAKLIRFAFRGYRFQMHVNGQSGIGYLLALTAALVGRFAGHPVALSWRGGVHQKYFPRLDNLWLRRSEEHTSELQSHSDLVCRLLLEKKKND